jgi:hypothetical protein
MLIDDRLDASWLLPSLAVGGRLSPDLASSLAGELGVRRVVDLRLEDRDDEALLVGHGMQLLHLPTADLCAITLERIRTGVRWVNAQIDAGERVLVHCEHGIGRSVLLACCVLVSRGDGPLRALSRAKQARPRASPSPEQLEALLAWSRAEGRVAGAGSAGATWEELADVAYGRRAPVVGDR